jgi:hypothetical protein
LKADGILFQVKNGTATVSDISSFAQTDTDLMATAAPILALFGGELDKKFMNVIFDRINSNLPLN